MGGNGHWGWTRYFSKGRSLIPSRPGHERPSGVVERSIDCMVGSPYRETDVGNAFADLLRANDPGNPETVFTVAVDHWAVEDRIAATFQLYQGKGGAHLIVIHHEVDEQTRACELCGKVVGTPLAEKPEVVADRVEWVDNPDS